MFKTSKSSSFYLLTQQGREGKWEGGHVQVSQYRMIRFRSTFPISTNLERVEPSSKEDRDPVFCERPTHALFIFFVAALFP